MGGSHQRQAKADAGRRATLTTPPHGFLPYQRSSPYLDLIGPLYESADDPLIVGLWLEHKHTNSREFVHAGLLVALADTILGHAILRTFPASPSLVTASLTTDFTGSAYPGTWLQGQAEVRHHGRRVSFASAAFHANDRLVMTASGIFVSTGVTQ